VFIKINHFWCFWTARRWSTFRRKFTIYWSWWWRDVDDAFLLGVICKVVFVFLF